MPDLRTHFETASYSKKLDELAILLLLIVILADEDERQERKHRRRKRREVENPLSRPVRLPGHFNPIRAVYRV